MLEKALVHMLPTDRVSRLTTALHYGNRLRIVHEGYKCDPKDEQFQHLYFTTDEEIKEGDWYLLHMEKTGWQVRQLVKDSKTSDSIKTHLTDWVIVAGSRKIVATTNPDLWYKHPNQVMGKPDLVNRIPTDFIEAYVRAEGKITEVLLEQERCVEHVTTDSTDVFFGRRIKLRNNGTVIIHPVKERTYTEEDMHNAFNAGMGYGVNGSLNLPFNQWFKKNYPE